MTTLPPKRRSAKKKVWPYVVLGTILIFVLAALAGVFFAQSSLLDRAKDEQKDELLTAKDKATIMIMGVDERTDDVGRSDTLMVATIDPHKNEAALLSIPRDTRVAIPKNGYDKINAAYAYGGEKLTQRTVEDFLGIRIDHYVIINTHAFQKIIDAIGGVTVTIPVDINDPDYTGLVMPAGVYEMDGNTAMLFSRVRHGFALGDYQRQANQRILIQAIVQKLRSNPPLMPAAADSLGSVLKTTYHCYDLIPVLARMAMQPPTIYSASIPSTTQRIRGVDYVIADGPATATQVQAVLIALQVQGVQEPCPDEELPAQGGVPEGERRISQAEGPGSHQQPGPGGCGLCDVGDGAQQQRQGTQAEQDGHRYCVHAVAACRFVGNPGRHAGPPAALCSVGLLGLSILCRVRAGADRAGSGREWPHLMTSSASDRM